MSQALVQIPDLWQPWRWPARLLIGSFVFVQLLMAATAVVQMDVWAPNILGFGAFAGAMMLLTVNWGHELPGRVAVLAAVAVVFIAGVLGTYGFASAIRVNDRYLGAAITVLMVLLMWGRFLIVWLTFATFAAVQFTWCAIDGVPLLESGPLMLRHMGTLLVTTAMASSLKRVASQLSRAAERRQQREQSDAVRVAVDQERALQFSRIDALAGPILKRMLSRSPLDASEREQARLIEATLRDTVSGRGWASTEVLAAARAARERGVIVVLLDDSQGRTGPESAALTELVGILAGLTDGRCVARLLPPGRAVAASILIEDSRENARVVELKRPGTS